MNKDEIKQKDLESLKDLCENKTVISVRVDESVKFIAEKDGKVSYGVKCGYQVEGRKKVILIRPENLNKRYTEESIQELIGEDLSVIITKVKAWNKVFAKQQRLAKKKPVKKEPVKYEFSKENERKIIKDFDNFVNKELEAKIYRFTDFGAFLVDENNTRYFLYDSGFAYGYISIRRVKKIGDVLKVKITKCNEEKNTIYVTMVEKYKEEMSKQPEDFKEDEIVKGRIVKKTSTLCFVNISPMIDALCFPIDGFEVGDETFIQIIGVRDLGNRKTVRGRIVLTKFDDEFKL